MSGGPRLIRISGGGERGETFPLQPGPTVIGREEGDLVFNDDRLMSGTHAKIEVSDGKGGAQGRGDSSTSAILSDAGSRNGVYIRIREPRELEDGDVIAVGKQVVRFRQRHPSDPLKWVR